MGELWERHGTAEVQLELLVRMQEVGNEIGNRAKS